MFLASICFKYLRLLCLFAPSLLLDSDRDSDEFFFIAPNKSIITLLYRVYASMLVPRSAIPSSPPGSLPATFLSTFQHHLLTRSRPPLLNSDYPSPLIRKEAMLLAASYHGGRSRFTVSAPFSAVIDGSVHSSSNFSGSTTDADASSGLASEVAPFLDIPLLRIAFCKDFQRDHHMLHVASGSNLAASAFWDGCVQFKYSHAVETERTNT